MDPFDHHFERLYQSLAISAQSSRAAMVARAVAARGAYGSLPDSEYRLRWGIDEAALLMVRSAIESALAVRQRAYAPYSRFRVGAAVLDASGNVWRGVNVENASYGLTLCAERAALAAARADGADDVLLVCIVADTQEPISPCGACRQWLAELTPHAIVAMLSVHGSERWVPAAELLPLAFSQNAFHSGAES